MKHILTFFITLLITNVVYSQVVVTVPEFPTENDSITVFLDTTQPGAEELLNYTGTVYAHTGVNTNFGDWQHVIGDWGNNQNQPALTRLGSNLYKLVIGFPREFYSVTNSSEQIYQLVFVFRSADGTKQTRPDIFINIYEPGLNLIVESPEVSVSFGDPQRSPAFVKEGSSVEVIIKAVEIETLTSSLTLFVDNNQVAQTNTDSLNYLFNYSDYPSGPHDVVAVGVDTAGSTDSTDFIMFVNPTMVNQIPPQGIEAGITINSPSSVTFELLAPYKDFVYLIGDFSDWKVESQYFLNRYAFSADSVVW